MGLIGDSCSVRPHTGSATKVYSAILYIAFQTIFFILIVLGTYGTFEGGLEQTSQSYLKPAFISVTFIFAVLSLRQAWYGKSRMSFWIFQEPVGQLLLVFFAILLIGLFVVPEKIGGVFATITATVATLLFITNKVNNRVTFNIVFNFLAVLIYFTSIIASIAGAYTYWIGSFSVGPLLIEYNQIFWRVNSWFMTSTGFGFFLGLGVISASYYLEKSASVWLKIAHAVTIAGLIVGMFLSGARSSISALLMAWFFYLITRFGFRAKYFLSILVVLAVVSSVRMIPDDLSQEILVVRRFIDQEDTATLGGRTDMWNEAIEIFSNQSLLIKLFGSGFGTFSETLGWDIGAHSGFLRIVIEHGFLGLAVVIFIFIITFLFLIRAIKSYEYIDLELRSLFLFFTTFMVGEVVLPQLFGISIEYIIFLCVMSLIYLRLRMTARNLA